MDLEKMNRLNLKSSEINQFDVKDLYKKFFELTFDLFFFFEHFCPFPATCKHWITKSCRIIAHVSLFDSHSSLWSLWITVVMSRHFSAHDIWLLIKKRNIWWYLSFWNRVNTLCMSAVSIDRNSWKSRHFRDGCFRNWTFFVHSFFSELLHWCTSWIESHRVKLSSSFDSYVRSETSQTNLHYWFDLLWNVLSLSDLWRRRLWRLCRAGATRKSAVKIWDNHWHVILLTVWRLPAFFWCGFGPQFLSLKHPWSSQNLDWRRIFEELYRHE